MANLQYLLTLTPLETWRLVRQRLPGKSAWTTAELLSSGKHNRGIRFAELLLRQEAIVRRHMPWDALEFAGRSVVEVGCGPLGGFGPLVLFCGARCFESADPEWDPEIFFDPAIRDRYLRPFHADLCALYGERMEFEAFIEALRTRMTVHRAGFQAAPLAGSTDVVLSQSCLEHVFPLDDIVAKLAAIQKKETRFLHLVDFGNHYPTGNPFDGLYEQPPAAYIARRGKAINLARMPDIAAVFSRHDIAAAVIPSRKAGATYGGTIHPHWRERYDDDALFTQLALVVSKH